MNEPTHLASGPTTLAMTRQRLESAPQWAKAAISAERERRGLPDIFTNTAAPNRCPSRSPATRVLVGAAASGVSKPHRLNRTDAYELLPEVISPGAWEMVRSAVECGEQIAFQNSHQGKPFAYSNSPDVRISFDPVAGMLFELHGDAARGFKWPAGGFASIGFIPHKWVKRMIGSQWVREIQALTIRHVALLKPHDPDGGPAYPLARVLSVQPDQVAKARLQICLEAIRANRGAGI